MMQGVRKEKIRRCLKSNEKNISLFFLPVPKLFVVSFRLFPSSPAQIYALKKKKIDLSGFGEHTGHFQYLIVIWNIYRY